MVADRKLDAILVAVSGDPDFAAGRPVSIAVFTLYKFHRLPLDTPREPV